MRVWRIPLRGGAHWVMFFCLSCSSVGARAGGPFTALPGGALLEAVVASDSLGGSHSLHHSRALAAGLAVTLGPFGAHRHYLGAGPKVPLIYSLTFGGFGVLVLIDLGHILFTRDLERFAGDQRVLMWTPEDGTEATPP